jgi:hypothetical protein
MDVNEFIRLLEAVEEEIPFNRNLDTALTMLYTAMDKVKK